MESLEYFKNNKLSSKDLKNTRGMRAEPKVYETGAFIDDNGTKEDVHYDNDGDGELTPGDSICWN
ncbi:hypothetical protein FIA58_011670 [Flavobacterium jejuense]|uniref:Uncharacterized protein n=1 Tax=Flavobacterium jejuense TaxID=1544455 RepID=A0ABX0IUX5_9FLAO|nr:hypothetical protein [Flavobacterium jejuense]NHN26338.1 hypothetical protein [Flavobacterium jejuense]